MFGKKYHFVGYGSLKPSFIRAIQFENNDYKSIFFKDFGCMTPISDLKKLVECQRLVSIFEDLHSARDEYVIQAWYDGVFTLPKKICYAGIILIKYIY